MSTETAGFRLTPAMVCEFQEATENTYSMFDCKRALMLHEGDFDKALRELTSERFGRNRLVSWDHSSLDKKSKELVEELGRSYQDCMQALKNCNGNKDFALHQLKGSSPDLKPRA